MRKFNILHQIIRVSLKCFWLYSQLFFLFVASLVSKPLNVILRLKKCGLTLVFMHADD